MMVSQEEWSKVCANKCIYKSKSDDASYAAPVAKKKILAVKLLPSSSLCDASLLIGMFLL